MYLYLNICIHTCAYVTEQFLCIYCMVACMHTCMYAQNVTLNPLSIFFSTCVNRFFSSSQMMSTHLHYMYVCMYVCDMYLIRAYLDYVSIHKHTYIHACILIHTWSFERMYIHTCIHANIHATYIHTYIHTYKNK